MNTTRIICGIALMACAVTIQSCKKDNPTQNTNPIDNEAISSFVDKSVSNDEDVATLRGGSEGGGCNWQNFIASCAVVTVSGESFPKTITIDYGTGCTDDNDITKSGMIIINLSNDMMNEGAVRTVTFDNFYVNNTHLEGSRTTTNTGINENAQPTFSRVVAMTITRNENTFQRNFSGDVVWISGFDTPECGDNVFSITGGGSCTRPDGTVVAHTIVEALLMDRTCGYITDGVEQITAPQGARTIDFGDGSCDDIASVT